ncbi:MAG: ribosomal-processing cysteine protease Prp [Clostridiaceae bacterium]|jgi:uncharacterized protein YsxB (DUF464 family)|nr:ribosomal-processing cysteine protease Prp [Clostridiaceae bacterium]
MITINLQHGPDGWIETFSASGHAGYAADGPDIICAAISVLAQTAIGSLQELAGIDPPRQLENGLIRFTLPDMAGLTGVQVQTAKLLMQSLVIGCKQIQASYGSRYIRFRHRQDQGGPAR